MGSRQVYSGATLLECAALSTICTRRMQVLVRPSLRAIASPQGRLAGTTLTISRFYATVNVVCRRCKVLFALSPAKIQKIVST